MKHLLIIQLLLASTLNLMAQGTSPSEELWRALTRMDVVLVMRDKSELVGTLASAEGENAIIVKVDGGVEMVKKSDVTELRGVPATEKDGHGGMLQYLKNRNQAEARLLNIDRRFGMYLGFGPGIIGVEYEKEKFHSYLSTPLLIPLMTDFSAASGSVGMGGTYKIGKRNVWRFDIFGHVNFMYSEWFSEYEDQWDPQTGEYIGQEKSNMAFSIGAGVGFHLTTVKGFIVSFKVPVLGASFGKEIDDPSDSVGAYYLSSVISMPIVVFGYRFWGGKKN